LRRKIESNSKYSGLFFWTQTLQLDGACVEATPPPTKDSFGGKKRLQSHRWSSFLAWANTTSVSFYWCLHIDSIGFFLVAKFHTSRTTTKGMNANGTKDSFAKKTKKLQSHYWSRFLAWFNTTSLRGCTSVFFGG
jgi:hypothetical protein